MGYRFEVELDGLLVAGFSEVRGLEAEAEVEEYEEGGVNNYVHRFPGRIKYPPLVFKRGVTSSIELWQWFKDVTEGRISRKGGAVILKDNAGNIVCRWTIMDSYPVRWSGPELNSNSSEIAVEELEIVHNGLDLIAGSGTS